MEAQTVESFYNALDIELVDIDNFDTLLFDISDSGDYATISDDDGNIPTSLDTPIVVNIYDENSVYQWCITLQDSYEFSDIYQTAKDSITLLKTLESIRQNNIAKYDTL